MSPAGCWSPLQVTPSTHTHTHTNLYGCWDNLHTGTNKHEIKFVTHTVNSKGIPQGEGLVGGEWSQSKVGQEALALLIRRWVQGVGSIKAQKCLYLKFSWCTLRLCYRVPKVVGIKQGGDGGAYQGPNIKDVCKCKKCKHYYTFPHSSTLRPSRSLEPVHGSISVPVTAAQAKPELSLLMFLFFFFFFLTSLLEYNCFTMLC